MKTGSHVGLQMTGLYTRARFQSSEARVAKNLKLCRVSTNLGSLGPHASGDGSRFNCEQLKTKSKLHPGRSFCNPGARAIHSWMRE